MLKGAYSAGKSVVAYLGIAQAQNCDRFTGKPFRVRRLDGSWEDVDFGAQREPVPMRVVVFDAEHSFDPVFATKWGIDVDEVYIIQAEYAEQGMDVADACIRSGECDLLLVDSVAALTPSVEIEESMEKWQVGVSARLMNKALRKWTSGLNAPGLLAETKCTILLINQMRLDIGGFKPKLTSPGGKGLDHYESIEVRFKQEDVVIDPITQRPVGSAVEFSLKKNKTAPMSNGGKFRLFYANAPELGYKVGTTDNDVQILRAASYWGLVEKAGAWYSLAGSDGKFQGIEAFGQHLKDNPIILEGLSEKVRDRELHWLNTGEAVGVTREKAKAEDA